MKVLRPCAPSYIRSRDGSEITRQIYGLYSYPSVSRFSVFMHLESLAPSLEFQPTYLVKMTSKYFLSATLLLSALFLLAPTVHSCVNYSGTYAGDQGNGQGEWLSATLWDDFGGSTSEQVCTMDGPANDGQNDGVYYFTCIADNYAAVFNVSNYIVEYANHGNNYSFYVPYENLAWTGCYFGCTSSQCFVA